MHLLHQSPPSPLLVAPATARPPLHMHLHLLVRPCTKSRVTTSLLQVDEDAAAGLEAFSRVAPAIPIIANVVISKNLFQELPVPVIELVKSIFSLAFWEEPFKSLVFCAIFTYIIIRAIKKLKSQSDSSLLSELRSGRREKIVELDGTVTTQPVLQHLGISTLPGRLILTDHALYFEPLKVVSYDKATCYDLEDDLKQSVKPELIGPWGTRLFDKAVAYKSVSPCKAFS